LALAPESQRLLSAACLAAACWEGAAAGVGCHFAGDSSKRGVPGASGGVWWTVVCPPETDPAALPKMGHG
jgi:hypothetical protein